MYLKAFPKYPTKIKKTNEGSLQIFDIVRKKHVNLTPEEWVRQHVLHYLVEDLKIDKVRVAVEKEFQYKSHSKRFDVMVYHNHRPKLLVECRLHMLVWIKAWLIKLVGIISCSSLSFY